jgi:hypothetical protein
VLIAWTAVVLAGYGAVVVALARYPGYARTRFPMGTIVSGYLLVAGTVLLVALTPAFATVGRTTLSDVSLSSAAGVVRAWGETCRLAAWFVAVLAGFVIACYPLGGSDLQRLVLGSSAVGVVVCGLLAIQVGIAACIRRRRVSTTVQCLVALLVLVGPIAVAPALESWTTERAASCTPGAIIGPDMVARCSNDPSDVVERNRFPTWWILAAQPALVVADATPWAVVSDVAGSVDPQANGLDPQTVLSQDLRSWRYEDANTDWTTGWGVSGMGEQSQTLPATWPTGLLILYGLGLVLLLLGIVRSRRSGSP